MSYVGGELELFQHAVNWKQYWSGSLRPCVRGKVLDVGCGLGVNAEHVMNPAVTTYTFLEPDKALLSQVDEHLRTKVLVEGERIAGTTLDLAGRRFDTILYVDVLEHIEDGQAELQRAFDLLLPGGHLLIVVPAYMFLFSPFDKAIGHFRRYDKAMLKAEMPPELEKISMRYLDSLGLLLSLGNKLVLRQSAPTPAQISFWDSTIVPASRITDKLFCHSFGRSLLSVHRKPVRSNKSG